METVSNVDGLSDALAEANCAPGYVATGGGFRITDAFIVTSSGSNGRNGWAVTVKNTATNQRSFVVLAECLKIG